LDRIIRLCLASTHFFPTHGGAQLRFLRYIPGLRKRGVLTHVLAGTPKQKKQVHAGPPGKAGPEWEDLGLEGDLIGQVPIERVNISDRGAKMVAQAPLQPAGLRGCEQSRHGVVDLRPHGKDPPRDHPKRRGS